MNELEWSLFRRRVRQPIKNWRKIVETAKQLIESDDRERWERVSLRILRNLYIELWRFPERVTLLKDNVVDLGDLGQTAGVLRKRSELMVRHNQSPDTKAELERLLANPTVVTPDSAISYIALREFGFRTKRRPRRTRYPYPPVYDNDPITVLLTTKVLYPTRLLSILSGQGSRVEKLLRVNQILAEATLPRLVGTPEDNAELRVINCRERLRRYEANLERIRRRNREREGVVHERTCTYFA